MSAPLVLPFVPLGVAAALPAIFGGRLTRATPRWPFVITLIVAFLTLPPAGFVLGAPWMTKPPFWLYLIVALAWIVISIVWLATPRPTLGASGAPVPDASGNIAAGWYADPDGKPSERYWSGSEWTAQSRPMTAGTMKAMAGGGGRTNGLAVVALVLAFLFPLIGLILGYVARSQIKRTGEGGSGMALAAIILGWIFTLLAVAWVVLVLMATSGSSY